MTDTKLSNVNIVAVCKVIRGVHGEMIKGEDGEPHWQEGIINPYELTIIWEDADGWQAEAPEGTDDNVIDENCSIDLSIYGEDEEPPAETEPEEGDDQDAQ